MLSHLSRLRESEFCIFQQRLPIRPQNSNVSIRIFPDQSISDPAAVRWPSKGRHFDYPRRPVLIDKADSLKVPSNRREPLPKARPARHELASRIVFLWLVCADIPDPHLETRSLLPSMTIICSITNADLAISDSDCFQQRSDLEQVSNQKALVAKSDLVHFIVFEAG